MQASQNSKPDWRSFEAQDKKPVLLDVQIVFQYALHGGERMSGWEKWKKRPQTVWLRKALLQVHLWCGIGLGLYVLLMSVTGSAIVFRRELTRTLAREPRVAIGPAARMGEDELGQIAKRAYPDYEVTRVSLRKNPDQAAEIWLARR